MTIRAHPSPQCLERLLDLIGEALAMSDAQALHAAGIALDTARLSVAEALADARRTSGGTAAADGWVPRIDHFGSGAPRRDPGSGA